MLIALASPRAGRTSARVNLIFFQIQALGPFPSEFPAVLARVADFHPLAVRAAIPNGRAAPASGPHAAMIAAAGGGGCAPWSNATVRPARCARLARSAPRRYRG